MPGRICKLIICGTELEAAGRQLTALAGDLVDADLDDQAVALADHAVKGLSDLTEQLVEDEDEDEDD